MISHTPDKKADALKMGAENFLSSKDKDWNKDHKFAFDFLISTVDNLLDSNLSEYFAILKVNGTFQNCG